jgi:hypothetical protein
MRYQFRGDLTTRDCKCHIPHQFVLPASSAQLDILFGFEPHRVRDATNLLTLTLLDPSGFRGAGHRGGDLHEVHIDGQMATPGYLPGPLPGGVWTVMIDTHMILPGQALRYRLTVTVDEDMRHTTHAPRPRDARPRRNSLSGAGWYRGDLHTHTDHSDAEDCSVSRLVELARQRQLDFVFLTDHNTIAGLDEMDAFSGEDLLTAGGIELTTFWGHAVCLGTREWVDWRIRPGTGDMARIADEMYRRDHLFVIAHPEAIGDPLCTGCTWRYGGMMPGNARLVEVWNGPWGGDANNEAALSLWYDWLNQGLRMVATAGTDSHGASDYAGSDGFNVVYSESLSETDILKAVRDGHLYLSKGPVIALEARNGEGDRWMMGDSVDQPVLITLGWANCLAGAQLRLMADGRLLDRWSVSADGERAWGMGPDQAHWVLAEVRDAKGSLLAITNPIFLQLEEKDTWCH